MSPLAGSASTTADATTLATADLRRPITDCFGRLRDFTRQHPQWWVLGGSAVAWTVLGLIQIVRTNSERTAIHVIDGPGPDAIATSALMSMAMMAPLAFPAVRYVAVTGFSRRRYRGPVILLAAFIGIWTAAGALIAVALAAIVSAFGLAVAMIVASVVAMWWQVSRPKRTYLRRCNRTMPLRAAGREADLDCLVFGSLLARDCLVTCWAFMALAEISSHSLVVTASLLALILGERLNRTQRPRTGALAVVGLSAMMLFQVLPTASLGGEPRFLLSLSDAWVCGIP